MNAAEAALTAREYFYGVCGTVPDIGFETVNITHFDFDEWEVECKVFDMLTSTMVRYRVAISDDEVESIRRI